MGAANINQKLATFAPSAPLRDFVSHYWLSFDNPDLTYPVLPDGAVDLVFQACGASAQSLIYGTTTTRTDISLARHSHYLGIRFRPGQSRHFMKAAAQELTDGCESAQGLLSFSLDGVSEKLAERRVLPSQQLVGKPFD